MAVYHRVGAQTEVYHMKWEWLLMVYDKRGVEIGIVASDEPPGPEFIVVITGTQDGISEVARCGRNEPGAWDKIRKRAKEIAELSDILEQAWFAAEYLDQAESIALPPAVSGRASDMPISETIAAFRKN